jgi:hypothetical protein
VSNLDQGRHRKRDLGELWQALVDESLEASQGSSVEASRDAQTAPPATS